MPTNFLALGSVEIRDAAGRITPSAPLSWEVRGGESKPLLHLWTDNGNLTRRVICILEQTDTRVLLSVERFGKSRPDRLELVRVHFQRSAKGVSREDFCSRLERILAEQVPDEEVDKIFVASDLERTLSRVYVRGISRRYYRVFHSNTQSEGQHALRVSGRAGTRVARRPREQLDVRVLVARSRAPRRSQSKPFLPAADPSPG